MCAPGRGCRSCGHVGSHTRQCEGRALRYSPTVRSRHRCSCPHLFGTVGGMNCNMAEVRSQPGLSPVQGDERLCRKLSLRRGTRQSRRHVPRFTHRGFCQSEAPVDIQPDTSRDWDEANLVLSA